MIFWNSIHYKVPNVCKCFIVLDIGQYTGPWQRSWSIINYHSAVSSLFSQERGLGKERRGWILEDDYKY